MIGGFYLIDSLRGDSQSEARLVVSLAIKASLALSFPLFLLTLRFFDERELHRIREIWQKLATALRRRGLTEVGLIIVAVLAVCAGVSAAIARILF